MRCKACHALLAGVLSAAALATGAAQASAARLTIKPSSGLPTTNFILRFRAPDTTGRMGSLQRTYVVSVNGPGGQNCVSGASWSVAPVLAHARVRETLKPRKVGGKWCIGTFRGTVDELAYPICQFHEVCPLYVVLRRTVGHFRFHVRRRDVSPPDFAGLTSATACTPGAQRPGETTPFHLRWKPATDNLTPSDQIVYQVFEASRASGEDFSTPTWTTPPGVRTFTTPGLPSHGSFYFVARARDRAGNVDDNTVERRGVDPCL